MRQTLSCTHCGHVWNLVEFEPEGDHVHVNIGADAYCREALQGAVPVVARHLRQVHGDEMQALRMERWAVSPKPGRRQAR